MESTINVLIIENARYCYNFFAKIIRLHNFQYDIVSTIDNALDVCRRGPLNLVILNLDIFDIDVGNTLTDIIKTLHDIAGRVPIMIVAGKKDAEETIEAMKAGACNVIFKPFLNIARIQQEILIALNGVVLNTYNKTPFQQRDENGSCFEGRGNFYGIIGKSAYIRHLFDIIRRIAPIDVSILILGESGTGKELIANAIHAISPRARNKFVAVNCGGIPEGLLESSFFGYEKGAFTGATKTMSGYFEEADKGTIFLDEIGNMSQRAQMTLLRVIQDRKYFRVGGTKPINEDVRIIASTNKNLFQAAENGDFRMDLYYRLNVVSIKTLPLRERKEDIPVLVSFFIERTCSKYGIGLKTVTPEAMAILESCNWPGNIRQLENFIEGVIALNPSGKIITSNDVEEIKIKRINKKSPDSIAQIPADVLNLNYATAKEYFERFYFGNLLSEKNQNISLVARRAKVHPATVFRKLKRLNLLHNR